MSTSMIHSRLEGAIASAGDALRADTVGPMARGTQGPVLEIVPRTNGEVGASIWTDGDAYVKGEAAFCLDPEDIAEGTTFGEPARLAVWLFGPERCRNPEAVYKWLSANTADDATLVLATEVPWMGKVLSPSEFAEYTDEEIGAGLVRVGFDKVRQVVPGPYFRLFTAERNGAVRDGFLTGVKDALDEGDTDEALRRLSGVEDGIESLAAVREYALLTAASHDLAGERDSAVEALIEALRIDPTCARAMCGLGRIAALEDDLENAALFFNGAINQQPFLVAALRGYGAVCEAINEKELAYDSMVAASELRPADEELLFEAVRLGNLLGRQDEVSDFLRTRIRMRSAGAEHETSQVKGEASECKGGTFLREA